MNEDIVKNISDRVNEALVRSNELTQRFGVNVTKATENINKSIEKLDEKNAALEQTINESERKSREQESQFNSRIDALSKIEASIADSVASAVNQAMANIVTQTEEYAAAATKAEVERKELQEERERAEKALALLKMRNDLEIRREEEDAEFKSREKIVRDKLRAEESARIAYYDEAAEAIENGIRSYYPELSENLDEVIESARKPATKAEKKDSEYKSRIDVETEASAEEFVENEKSQRFTKDDQKDIFENLSKGSSSKDGE